MLNMKKEKEALAAALEENDIAKKLNEAIKKTKAAKNEENGEDTLDEFTPVEELSLNIAGHLAFMVAERFEPIAEKIGPEAAKKLVVRIENSKPETAVNMLQSMFLANGMVHAAEELDLLSYCADHDSYGNDKGRRQTV